MIRLKDIHIELLEDIYEGDVICSCCKEPFGCTHDPDTDLDYDCVLDDGRLFHTGCHMEYLNRNTNDITSQRIIKEGLIDPNTN